MLEPETFRCCAWDLGAALLQLEGFTLLAMVRSGHSGEAAPRLAALSEAANTNILRVMVLTVQRWSAVNNTLVNVYRAVGAGPVPTAIAEFAGYQPLLQLAGSTRHADY